MTGSWWNRRSGDDLRLSPEEERWQAVVSAADWCITLAYNEGYTGIPDSVTVADVQLCADQDFGTQDVSAEQAAAALREQWYVRRCGTDPDLTTDAFDRVYCR